MKKRSKALEVVSLLIVLAICTLSLVACTGKDDNSAGSGWIGSYDGGNPNKGDRKGVDWLLNSPDAKITLDLSGVSNADIGEKQIISAKTEVTIVGKGNTVNMNLVVNTRDSSLTLIFMNIKIQAPQEKNAIDASLMVGNNVLTLANFGATSTLIGGSGMSGGNNEVGGNGLCAVNSSCELKIDGLNLIGGSGGIGGNGYGTKTVPGGGLFGADSTEGRDAQNGGIGGVAVQSTKAVEIKMASVTGGQGGQGGTGASGPFMGWGGRGGNGGAGGIGIVAASLFKDDYSTVSGGQGGGGGSAGTSNYAGNNPNGNGGAMGKDFVEHS